MATDQSCITYHDVWSKRKTFSLIKKMQYISLTKRWYKNNKHNKKINILQKIKILSLSFCLGSPWVRSLLGLKDSNVWGLLDGVGRILLFVLTFILALESFSLFSFAGILVGVYWNFQRSRRGTWSTFGISDTWTACSRREELGSESSRISGS